MNKKQLKLLAGNIILESNYSNSAKKQLLNYILDERDECLIKALILDQKIEKLDELAKEIVNYRFTNITEQILAEDTSIFISISRETICEFIETLKYNSDDLKEINNFIMNEASNYQILSMLIEGNLPDEKLNIKKEKMLIEKINSFADTSFICLSEAERIYQDPKQPAERSPSMTRSVGGQVARTGTMMAIYNPSMIRNLVSKLPSASAIGAKLASFSGASIGGLALAALLGYGAYKVYKNYLSKAAQACKTDPNKKECMIKYNMNALKAQISDLSKSAAVCNKAKDPEKCKMSIQSKIEKLKKRIEELDRKRLQ